MARALRMYSRPKTRLANVRLVMGKRFVGDKQTSDTDQIWKSVRGTSFITLGIPIRTLMQVKELTTNNQDGRNQRSFHRCSSFGRT